MTTFKISTFGQYNYRQRLFGLEGLMLFTAIITMRARRNQLGLPKRFMLSIRNSAFVFLVGGLFVAPEIYNPLIKSDFWINSHLDAANESISIKLSIIFWRVGTSCSDCPWTRCFWPELAAFMNFWPPFWWSWPGNSQFIPETLFRGLFFATCSVGCQWAILFCPWIVWGQIYFPFRFFAEYQSCFPGLSDFFPSSQAFSQVIRFDVYRTLIIHHPLLCPNGHHPPFCCESSLPAFFSPVTVIF